MLAATILVLVAVGAMVLVAWLADHFLGGDDWDERGSFRLWPACALPYYFVRVGRNAPSIHGTPWDICVSAGGSKRYTKVLVSIPASLTYYVMFCADVESQVNYANGRTGSYRGWRGWRERRKAPELLSNRKNRALLVRNIEFLIGKYREVATEENQEQELGVGADDG